MTDPVKRPALIRERFRTEIPLAKPIVLKWVDRWVLSWGHTGTKNFTTFDAAIKFATADREIGGHS